MKEIKILGIIFVLSLIISILVIFFPIYFTGARIHFFPGRDTGNGDVLGISILLSSIVGGIFGFVVGVVSVGYLAATIGILGELRVPVGTVIGYSVVIGLLLSGFIFIQTTNQYETYGALLRAEWAGLAGSFAYGFITAILPMLLAKKYFRF